ncbi:MAG: cytochrome c oxidase subunit II [Myxococcales bacterium]|nr:cytochrome c oxidase subunit II [Myxococcales bacterium]
MTTPSPDILNQLPLPASTFAGGYDLLFYFLFWLSAVFFVGVCAAALYFVVRYRRRVDTERPGPTAENKILEYAWTFLPIIPLAMLFHFGFKGYIDGVVAPGDAIDIRVKARQWSWEFVYPDGTSSPGVLAVPVHRPVRLIMSSEDVIHSFFVPEFRVKRDVVPGMYSTLWFEATRTGEFTAFCAEYCGAPPNQTQSGHFGMLAKVKVLSEPAYAQWLKELGGPPAGKTPEQWGEMLYTQYACITCHSNKPGVQLVGPNFVGLWSKTETLESGDTVVVDENYIRESILDPNKKRVKGFTGIVMPPFVLDDARVDAIIAYIKSLK